MQTSFSTLDFRKAMGKFATGVTVVTTRTVKGIHGMTANAFTSVSLEPTLVLVSVAKKANTHRYIQETKHFGINILREGQDDISNHFAGKSLPHVQERLNYFWVDDIPLLPDCLANIACRLWASYDGGDHTLYVGEVVGLNISEGDPLLFFDGNYRRLEK